MRHGIAQVLGSFLLLGSGMAMAQEPPLPEEVQAVQKYIMDRDYPELFGSEPYRTRIEDVLVTDLVRDGSKEVIVLFFPHYRQSAPIVIYRVSKDLEVTRVSEGLAPGPLIPLSGDYLDSHTLGQAVDLSVDSKNGHADREALLRAFRKSGLGGMVEYKTFVHTDGRKGALAYIDMRNVEVPKGKTSCAEFEFSRVQAIGAGALENHPGKVYLAARVGSQMWLYLVEKFLADGLLQKTVHVAKVPRDFARFAPAADGLLSYETTAGALMPLKVGSFDSGSN